jgi:hypothetical protein
MSIHRHVMTSLSLETMLLGSSLLTYDDPEAEKYVGIRMPVRPAWNSGLATVRTSFEA